MKASAVDPMTDGTVPVTVTVLQIDRISAGKLLALASVEIEIAGVSLEMRGLRVIRTAPGRVGVEPPCYRGATGAAVPAVILPEELSAAIANAVLDEFESIKRQPAGLYV
jgi:hypothetical protein